MNRFALVPVLAMSLSCKPPPPDAAPPEARPLVVDPVRPVAEPESSEVQPVPVEAGAARSGFDWNDVPIPADFASLCGGRVYGIPGTEIHWENFTSTRPVGESIAWFREALGAEESSTENGATWRLVDPDRVLHVGTALRRPDPSCPPLPEGTGTVLEASRKVAR